MDFYDVDEICWLNIEDDNGFTNTYMFFVDGAVVREYSEGDTIRHAVDIIHVRDIETDHRLKILKVVPKEHRMKIIDLFNQY